VTGVYPNPFNPRTSIDFALAQSSPVRVSIHDLTGRLVAVLVDVELLQGNHTAKWEGLDDAGRRVASGTYFVQFRAEGVRETRKITLIK
jgi:flagellar hook assembly protein FlgD